jgi:hypothetical protein
LAEGVIRRLINRMVDYSLLIRATRSKIRFGKRGSPNVRFAPKATELLRRRAMTQWAIKKRSSSQAIPTPQMIFSTTRLALRAEDHSDNSESPLPMQS